jgi:hypothetical protein
MIAALVGGQLPGEDTPITAMEIVGTGLAMMWCMSPTSASGASGMPVVALSGAEHTRDGAFVKEP